jgi:hypothetical protein
MAEKVEKTLVQERPKKSVKKSVKEMAGGVLAARRTRWALKKALPGPVARAAARLSVKASSVKDPGLQDVLKFGERLKTGQSRIFTPEETKASWAESDKQMKKLDRRVARKFGCPTA